ncbi:MAG: response regulator [Chloroflexi bacterium]|nr:response regulator [Chloroflexota bacterium]
MSTPPAEFIALVKDALEHLYDPAVLQGHELARMLLTDHAANTSRRLALRQALLDAIDRLRPEHSLPIAARQRRLHQLIELRYVEALPFREVMSQLALSQAQYHREQRHAVESLATLLWEDVVARSQPGPPLPTRDPHPHARHPELEAATHGPGAMVDLSEVARGLVDILREAAGDHGATLEADLCPGPSISRGSRTGIRQVMITMAGYVLSGARGGQLVLRVCQAGGEVLLAVAYEADPSTAGLQGARLDDRLEIARQLLEPVGGTLSTEPAPGRALVTASLPLCCHTLLVIDDNPDMVHLVHRLVAPRHYTVLGAGSVREGLQLAHTARPGAILLDLMLPEQDGWDALQVLKHDPATQDIPVLVCSILDERQMALALGAAEFVRKPLTRPTLLEALARWIDGEPLPAAGDQGPSGRTAAVG